MNMPVPASFRFAAAGANHWLVSVVVVVPQSGIAVSTGDASNDPELQSIMNSFRLISPLSTNTPGLDKDSAAYKTGRVFGCCFLPGVLIALIAGFIIWLVRRKTETLTRLKI